MQRRRVRILSIDGGGIKGIIPARILMDLEARTGRPCHELFDLVAGTSTGGILAVGLTSPNPATGRPYAASELLGLYVNEGRRIFSAPLLHQVATLGGVLGVRYHPQALEEILARYYGETRLSQTLKPLVITSFDTLTNQPWFFKTLSARVDPLADYRVRDVARATSAAPVYFPPHKIEVPGAPPVVAIDGGVVANDPVVCALAEAEKHWSALSDPQTELIVVSVGTGDVVEGRAPVRVPQWGLVGWAANGLLSILLGANQDAAGYEARQLLSKPHLGRYHRLQAPIARHLEVMDDTRPATLRGLQAAAEAYLAQESETLAAIAAALV